ncbi:MAG: hypothetical protein K0S38_554 [Candidatus Paceibacter sp.]|jgi:hypothetical protein|nr:hypothetical protein [Candidatus Paceibacter sp.]
MGLSQIPISEVAEGLGRLDRHDVDKAIWDRLRFEPEFARRLAQAIIQEDQRKSKNLLSVTIDFNIPRTRRLSDLCEAGFSLPLNNLMYEMLYSPTVEVAPKHRQLDIQQLGYEVSFNRAGGELARRGYYMSEADHAIAFAMVHYKKEVHSHVVVLGATCLFDGQHHCLVLTPGLSGYPDIFNLWSLKKKFPKDFRFLVEVR